MSDQLNWANALDESLASSITAVAQADQEDWSMSAGDLEWDCLATLRHIASDFVGYAGQLTAPRSQGYVPFDMILDGTPSPLELRNVLQSTGGILSSVVRTAEPTILSWHPYGMAGPADFAAMGMVELLVHTEDLSRGLGFPWTPPSHLCVRLLDHLFKTAPLGHEPWPTLLWATGRIALSEHERQQKWRWQNTGT